MTTRARFSATVDPDLLAVGRAAVAEGRADSLSAWVNTALERQVAHERRLQAMDEFIAEYEAEFGTITEADIAEAEEWAAKRTIHVDGRKTPPRVRRGAA